MERPEDARPFVVAMDALIARFRRESALWRDIAGEAILPPEPIDLDQRLAEMIELFAMEAATRGIRLTLGRRSGAVAFSDPHALSRLLFRAFRDSLGAASRTTDIEVAAWNTGSGQVRVAFSTGHELFLPRADDATASPESFRRGAKT
jgi:hypothetical protein